MLRLLREQRASQQDVRNLEISAVFVLDTIDLEGASNSSDSRVVLVNTSKALAGYRKDFEGSEFDPSRHESVARLLSLNSR